MVEDMARFLRWVLASVAASTLLLTAPAAAHDTLVEAHPGTDEVLTEPPAEVALRFSGELLDLNQAVVVTDSAGATVAEGEPTIEGTWARLPLPELPAGAYALTWSVVSSDGHRIQGEHAFTVEAAAEPAPSTPPADEATPTPPAAEETTSAPDDDAAGQPDDDTTTPGSAPDGVPTWAVVAIAVGGVAAIAALVVLAARRSRGDGPR